MSNALTGTTVTKKDWVEMFEQIGLDEPAMLRWHALFEQRAPDGHQELLEWLGIGADEIARIRARARGAA